MVRSSLHLKLHVDHISRFYSSLWTLPVLYNKVARPPKIASSPGGPDSHLMHGSLGPPEYAAQTASRFW